ncbi:MerR family transcriptional regulator [Ferruginibacter sp. HRS2-29]|uniref:MerR family transcriptional regulator n=1 Tax=Ferruginibacter sp. HRS2-29 TaxID=2487334 RepID=UPI0020CE8B58|nr:MerR family transcriptional regulator [Ferruginibacter sp. HRS2-29]MCP9749940.1 MerR family transcriptional regulator [Ferruginibacter sp. HRS2-29]
MNSFTIKDLENLSGIKAHTLRIWEQRYSFLKPERTYTNIRYYSTHELKVILNIALLNKYGFKVSHIDKMSDAERNEHVLALANTDAQLERMVNELVKSMVDIDMEAFENVLDTYIRQRGVERTITQIIFPFLEKVGILWLTNHINPAQEHLVSNIIRQKLIVGIESLKSPASIKKSLLLFLPEGEHHELGLLFMHYLLKSHGVKVVYLGANIPLADVEYVVKLQKPDFLYTHLTTVARSFSFEKFLVSITKAFPKLTLVVSGQLTNTYEKKIKSSVIFKKTFSEVLGFVNSL